ncbi:hypothetical protein XI05_24195 [Bradyrhizobium sp. CCBAU 11357]|nr:hypothetical protein [Bradyrhizobium sp. CCBAU 11357]
MLRRLDPWSDDPYSVPTMDNNWSHCIIAGEDIGDVLQKMIEWHFDREHVESVQDWLSERIVAHEALGRFLSSGA